MLKIIEIELTIHMEYVTNSNTEGRYGSDNFSVIGYEKQNHL